MKYMIQKIGIRGKVLVFRENNELVCYKKGHLDFYNLDTNEKYKTIRLPLPMWKRVLCNFRILERLLHIEVRWAVQIDDAHLLVQFNRNTLLVNIDNLSIIKEEVAVKGNPLSIVAIKDIPGFKDQYIIGDYTRNKEREEVCLYGRNDKGKWNKVWEFTAGTVRHIHGCFCDRDNECVYILTGDENKESGIWKATDNFQNVEPLLVGKQQYRACQMNVVNQDIIFFTDAPSQPNFIYRYDGKCLKKISRLSGTCIYGTHSKERGYYSTTCEPEAYAKNRIDYWLTSKSGDGVIGNRVEVFTMDKDGNIDILISFEHDGLPLRLFQYGTVVFSNVISNRLYITPLCVKKYDMRVFEIKLETVG